MTIRDTFTIAMVLVAVGSTNTWGAQTQDPRWVRVDRKPEIVIYVDRLRARVIDSVLVEVWVSWELTDTQTLAGKMFNRMVALFRLDCKRTQSMQLEGAFYLNDEFVIRVPTPTAEREWVASPPQSIGETFTIRGCLIARGQPTEPVE